MFKETRIEVLSLVGHFILAGLLILGYIFLRTRGIDDETMRFALIAGVTYFFGAASTSIAAARQSKQNDNQTPNDTTKSDPPKNGGVGI